MIKLKRLPRVSVLVQFIMMYLVIAFFILSALTPIYHQTLNELKHNYIYEANLGLKKSAEFLQSEIQELYCIPLKMNELEYYNEIRLLQGNNLTLGSYPYIYLTNKIFMKQLLTIDYANEVFLLLKNSEITFAGSKIYLSFQEYLDAYIRPENAAAIIEQVFTGNSKQIFIPEMPAMVNNLMELEYLTLVLEREDDSAVVGALFSTDAISRLFSLSELPEASILYITAENNRMLMTYHYEGEPVAGDRLLLQNEQYSLIRSSISFPDTEIVIGIPDSYFDNLIHPMKQKIDGYILISIMIALGFSVVFSIINYLPVLRLLLISRRNGVDPVRGFSNEYNRIKNYMELSNLRIYELNDNIHAIERNMRQNLFVMLLFRNVHSDRDIEAALKLIPQLKSTFRVAVAINDYHADSPDDDLMSCFLFNKLRAEISDRFLIHQLDKNRTILLFEDSIANIEYLEKAISNVNQSAHKTFSIHCGVSRTTRNLDNLYAAFCQAQIALEMAAQSIDGCICFSPEGDDIPVPVHSVAKLQRIYDYIMTRDRKSIDNYFSMYIDQTIHDAGRGRDLIVQNYYFIRSMIESAAVDAHINLADELIAYYDEQLTISELFDKLKRSSIQIVNRLDEQQTSEYRSTQQNIIKYIDSHFDLPDIYAESIAEKFKVSRNFIYAAVKHETSRTPKDYIEDLRLKKAYELLTGTVISVSDIALRCGYNSVNTFYKVFKKRYGKSPSCYR